MAPLTARTPPQPNAYASDAAHCRRMRSSINAASDRYFREICFIVAENCMTP